MKWSTGRALLGLGITVGTGAVIAGVVIVGTPVEGRMQRLDEVRAGDLRAIMLAIDSFQERNARLPDSLAALAADPHTQASINDPDTGRPYEYRILGEDAYELCAVFALAYNHRIGAPDAFWLHDEGRVCFSLATTVP